MSGTTLKTVGKAYRLAAPSKQGVYYIYYAIGSYPNAQGGVEVVEVAKCACAMRNMHRDRKRFRPVAHAGFFEVQPYRQDAACVRDGQSTTAYQWLSSVSARVGYRRLRHLVFQIFEKQNETNSAKLTEEQQKTGLTH